MTIFVTDMATNFPSVVEHRRRHFTAPYPADSIVEVAGLYTPEAQIEIEAIAVVGGERGVSARSARARGALVAPADAFAKPSGTLIEIALSGSGGLQRR